MGFFDDFTTALETYPDDYVSLEIINFNVPGDVLNTDDTGSFRVQVHNTGPLQMTDFRVRITALNGMLVKDPGALAPYVDEVISGVGQFPDILAHNWNELQENVGGFGFKAPSSSQPARDLIEVSVYGWNGVLLHMTEGHTKAAPNVKAVYRDRVRAI